MANVRANGPRIRRLREALRFEGKRISQSTLAGFSADRDKLSEFKGEIPPNWINEFSHQWLSRVETQTKDHFNDALLRSLAYILGTSFASITFAEYENPYKGLRAFGFEDSDLFGGRDGEARELHERLKKHALVGIIGASGGGKSSLAFAGVCPLIRTEQPDWEVLALRVGAKPLHSLFYALDQWLFPNAEERLDRPTRIRKFRNNLKEGGDALRYYLEGAQRETERSPVLIIDQWEELYTLCRDSDDRDDFLQNLVEAAQSGSARVLLTVRGDFYDELLCSPPAFFELLRPNLIDLQPMTRDQLRSAITKPVQLTGLQFADGLVDQLLRDVGTEMGQLPILQFCLSALWVNRDVDRNFISFESYKRLGGIKAIIRTHADNVFKTVLDPAEQKITRITLPTLVNLGDHGNDVKLSLPLAQFGEEQQRILRRLSDEDCRLLTIFRSKEASDQDIATENVELAHEELIRSWPALRTWLNEDLAFHQQLSRLRAFHKQFQDSGRNADLLIPDGKPLEDARALLNDYGSTYLGELKPYIEDSIDKWEKRRDQELELERARRIREEELRRDAEVSEQSARSRTWIASIGALISVFALVFAVYGAINSRYSEKRTASSYARSLADVGDYTRALATLLNLLPRWYEPSSIVPAETLSSLYFAVAYSPEVELPHGGSMTSAAFSPDGTRIVTSDFDGMVRVWDSITGAELVPAWRPKHNVSSVAFSPDGTRILTVSYASPVQIWDANTGEEVDQNTNYGDFVVTAAFSRDGARIVTGDNRGTVRVWSTNAGAEPRFEMPHGTSISSVSFSPDGLSIAAGNTDGNVRVWDAANGEQLGQEMRHETSVETLAFSPDGSQIVTGAGDGIARVWGTATGFDHVASMRHGASVTSVAFSPDGSRIATASSEGTARVWSTETLEEVRLAMRHEAGISSVAFSSEGSRLVTSSRDGKARIWDAATSRAPMLRMQHGSDITTVAFSPDGSHIVSGDSNGLALAWDATTGREMELVMRQEHELAHVTFSPDSKRIVTTSASGAVVIWDAITGRENRLELHGAGFVNSAALSLDGTRIVTGAIDGRIQLWDAMDGEEFPFAMRHGASVTSVAFNANGSRIIAGDFFGTVRVWDAKTGEPLGIDMRHEGGINFGAFSANDARIVTASSDGTARVWDAKTGEPLGLEMRHEHGVTRAAISSDGTRIVTGDIFGKVRVWDATTGEEMGLEMYQDESVTSAAFSPDGTRIVVGGFDGSVRVWDVSIDYDATIAAAKKKLNALNRN